MSNKTLLIILVNVCALLGIGGGTYFYARGSNNTVPWTVVCWRVGSNEPFITATVKDRPELNDGLVSIVTVDGQADVAVGNGTCAWSQATSKPTPPAAPSTPKAPEPAPPAPPAAPDAGPAVPSAAALGAPSAPKKP